MTWVPVTLLIASFAANANCSDIYDVKLLTHEIMSKYFKIRRKENQRNLPVYEYEAPNNVNKKRMLIGVYDVYGWAYPNLKQVADEFAVQSGAFIVALPDFFRGDSWNVDGDACELREWVNRVGDWDLIVKSDLINLIHHYQSNGVEEFAMFGMCYESLVATNAAIELSEYFKYAVVEIFYVICRIPLFNGRDRYAAPS